MKNKGISRGQLLKDIERGVRITQQSIKCKHCGHSVLFSRREKTICSWCGHWVFKDQKEEFKYRLENLL